MGDRTDVDALEAREAALTKDLERKQREVDAAAGLLREARGESAPEVKRPRIVTPRRLLVGALIACAGASVLVILLVMRRSSVAHLASELDPAPVLTCAQVEPDYQEAELLTDGAYAHALAEKGLSKISLEARARSEPDLRETEVDAAAGVALTAWKPFTYDVAGRTRTAIASEVYQAYYRREAPAEFVTDGHGGIWRVKRAPQERTIETVSVASCWGCWGAPPSGEHFPETLTRDEWFLPDGQTYRGEVEVAYDAPTITFENVDGDCTVPP